MANKVVHFDLLPFCPILASTLVSISFICSTLGTLFKAYYSVAVNGNFSAETRYKKYWKLEDKSTKNPLKNYAKKEK